MNRATLVGVLSLTLGGCARDSVFPEAGAPQGLIDSEGALSPEACRGVDLRPEEHVLDESALVALLARRGFRSEVTRARADLTYVEVPAIGRVAKIRLRVARLSSPIEAAQELHRALDERGAGGWGVHRGNLAVLAPSGERDRVVSFAVKTGLACWGVLTIEGGDGAYVLPGGYAEL